MTYEYAVYFKLLLLCGYTDELEQYLDTALEEQDPLSDIVLELSFTGSDNGKKLLVLNEYILQVQDCDIDYDKSVFNLVMAFLKRKYIEDNMPMKSIVDLMYTIAEYTERYFYEPWNTMYLMDDLFSEAEAGYIDKDDFKRKFDAFINDNICFCDYPPVLPKESLFKRLIKKICGNC